MNKAELAAAVAEKIGASKKVSEQAVNAVFEAITESLVKGDKVQLVGFGAFEVRERGERIGRNPQTKEDQDPCFQGSCFQGRQGFEGSCGEVNMIMAGMPRNRVYRPCWFQRS